MPSTIDLRIYAIHEEELVSRKQRLFTTLQVISSLCGEAPKIILVNQPSTALLRPLMAKLQEKTEYGEIGDADFDRQREMLGAEHFSNLEKHKEAWKRIVATSLSDKQDEVHLVLEDDSILLQETHPHLTELLECAPRLMRDWDMIFLGLSDPAADPHAALTVTPMEPTKTKILPCKDAYLLRPSAAKALLSYFQPMLKLRYGLRQQLSYKFWTEPGFLRVGFCNKRLFLDGSKLGLCPSSIHPNNLLILNKEYMDLFAYLGHSSLSVDDVARIRELYKMVETLGSPDIFHIYGVLMYKAGRLTEAEEALTRAISETQKNGGILHARCDLLNNAINIYEKIQPDLHGLLALPSKYSKTTPPSCESS